MVYRGDLWCLRGLIDAYPERFIDIEYTTTEIYASIFMDCDSVFFIIRDGR